MRLERTVDGGADVGLAQRGPLGARYAHGHGAGVSGFHKHGNGLPWCRFPDRRPVRLSIAFERAFRYSKYMAIGAGIWYHAN